MSTSDVEDICKRLEQLDRHLQVEALKELDALSHKKEVSKTDLMKIFDACYLHLLKCYSARYESVREKAVETVSDFLSRFPNNDFHLFNVISTLKERLGQPETIETCETIRKLYVEQLHLLLRGYQKSYRGHVLHDCYSDITIILSKALRDPFPVVQREACACVSTLAQSAETYFFQASAGALAKSVYGVLNHKHSQSRIAAISALTQLALHVNANEQDLSRLLMEVSPLLMDSMPLVRLECGKLGIELLLNLRDRYSYFDRLIPLVLCCLVDTSEVQEVIKPLWVKCGQQYFEENEEELKKQELVDLPPVNYPIEVERPTIGCRAIVQRSLRLLKLIVRESGDWLDKVRTHSMRLLYQFVLHAENAMTAKFFEIYPDVARVCQDPDNSVSCTGKKVADLMGRLFCYADWCEHAFDGLEKYPRPGYLICFYHMFQPAIGPQMKDLLRVTRLLKAPDFSQSLKLPMQTYVYKTVSNILERSLSLNETDRSADHEEELEQLHKNLYIIIMKIMAIALDNTANTNAQELVANSNSILEKLAMVKNISCAELHEKHFNFALDYVQNLDTGLEQNCEPIILFYGLIKTAKFRASYLENLQLKLNEVFANCADCAKVKMFTCIAATMLSWSESINRPVTESAKLLQKFLLAVIDPHLGWRAGSSAEVMRTLAISTLCAMSQGAEAEAKIVFPLFAKYFSNLLEDRAISTRRYAVQCLLNFAELPLEQLKPIAYGILSRMDDPSSETRILAIKALPKLTPKIEYSDENAKFDIETWEAFIKHAFDILFLHYETPDLNLKNTIKETIKELAEKHPQICENCYKQAVAQGGSPLELNQLKDDLFPQ